MWTGRSGIRARKKLRSWKHRYGKGERSSVVLTHLSCSPIVLKIGPALIVSGNFWRLCGQKLWRKDDVHFVIIESRKAARDLRWEGVR